MALGSLALEEGRNNLLQMGPVLLTCRSGERVQLDSWHLSPQASCYLNAIIYLCRKDDHTCHLPKSQGVSVVPGVTFCSPCLVLRRYEAQTILAAGKMANHPPASPSNKAKETLYM